MPTFIKIFCCLLVGTSLTHGQNAQDRLNSANKGGAAPKEEPKKEAAKEIEKGGGLDLSGGMLLNKVLQFGYYPSERDPFISHTVLSPFVTEEDLPEAPNLDQEKINAARKAIEDLVKSKVEIGGISTGKIGAGFAVGNEGQILKPGELLLIPMEEEEQAEVDLAVQAAVAAGATGLGIAVYKNNLLLETKRVEDKSVIFKSPVRMSGEEEAELIVDYSKKRGFDPKPTVEQVKTPQKAPAKTPAANPPKNP